MPRACPKRWLRVPHRRCASKCMRGIAVAEASSMDVHQAASVQTRRQVAHWVQAAARLDLDELASPQAWAHLERYLGLSLRKHLSRVLERLMSQARVLTTLHQ